jgi:hypothetical protein
MTNFMTPPSKKNLDYPEETEGSRLAAQLRRQANKMTSTQRKECLRKARQIFVGQGLA